MLERQFPGVDYTEIEPALSSLVALVLDNPNLNDKFEREFEELLLLRNFGAAEILQFSMHILRWESVKRATRKALDECDDARRGRILEGVYESFDPDWEDRDLFRQFRSQR
ncbi:hypothetical protein [Micromonospora rubida]